jgi:hypothetical protein
MPGAVAHIALAEYGDRRRGSTIYSEPFCTGQSRNDGLVISCNPYQSNPQEPR